MGSMVVGVVVSAFLLTPFFVCQEHRRDRHGQKQRLAQQALRVTPEAKSFLGSQFSTGTTDAHFPVGHLALERGAWGRCYLP